MSQYLIKETEHSVAYQTGAGVFGVTGPEYLWLREHAPEALAWVDTSPEDFLEGNPKDNLWASWSGHRAHPALVRCVSELSSEPGYGGAKGVDTFTAIGPVGFRVTAGHCGIETVDWMSLREWCGGDGFGLTMASGVIVRGQVEHSDE